MRSLQGRAARVLPFGVVRCWLGMGMTGPEALIKGTGILLRINGSEDPMTTLPFWVSSLDLSGTLLPLPDSFILPVLLLKVVTIPIEIIISDITT